MTKELEIWQFVFERLKQNENVMLLVVAESSGSSPGRAGYKMAVGADGELVGSIGGGVMEVNLVEQCRRILLEPTAVADGLTSFLRPQVHQRQAQNPSGMICSGKQTVIFRLSTPEDATAVNGVIDALERRKGAFLSITSTQFSVWLPKDGIPNRDSTEDIYLERLTNGEFVFRERIGHRNELHIIGGGHCALALSELMSRMDFYIRLFDDRPELNTLEKNKFAYEIKIVDSYEQISEFIPSGSNAYVVVMTLGYASDEVVIRSLLDKDFKYFGVLGSKAKMAVLLNTLANEGFAAEKLARIHTPIGLPINSHTPEEIAVSIAAEIISVKNSA